MHLYRSLRAQSSLIMPSRLAQVLLTTILVSHGECPLSQPIYLRRQFFLSKELRNKNTIKIKTQTLTLPYSFLKSTKRFVPTSLTLTT